VCANSLSQKVAILIVSKSGQLTEVLDLLSIQGGFHWFNLYDFYAAYYGLLLVPLIMCLVVNWG